MDERYESLDQCLVDIMANTDAPYRVALLAAKYVYEEGWSYDNHPLVDRGIMISPDFDLDDPMTIYLSRGDIV